MNSIIFPFFDEYRRVTSISDSMTDWDFKWRQFIQLNRISLSTTLSSIHSLSPRQWENRSRETRSITTLMGCVVSLFVFSELWATPWVFLCSFVERCNYQLTFIWPVYVWAILQPVYFSFPVAFSTPIRSKCQTMNCRERMPSQEFWSSQVNICSQWREIRRVVSWKTAEPTTTFHSFDLFSLV